MARSPTTRRSPDTAPRRGTRGSLTTLRSPATRCRPVTRPRVAITTAPPPAPPGPASTVGWAVAAIVCFWPLAFVAMTRAIDVYPLWAAGRHAEAEAASATAKKLGVISLVIAAVVIVLYFVFVFAMVGLA